MKKRIKIVNIIFALILIVETIFIVQYLLSQEFNDNNVIQGVKVGDYVEYIPNKVNVGDDDYRFISKVAGYDDYNIAELDYASDHPLEQEKLTWRLLEIKEDKIVLICSEPTKSKVFLYD